MPKIHDFMDFGLQNGAQKLSTHRRRVVAGTDFVQTSFPDGFQTSFFMFFDIFLDVFGAYFEGFGLDFGAINLEKMPKTC